MKQLKHIVNWVVWTILGLYAALMIAVRVPWVQQEIGSKVADLVGRKLGTKVAVGRVDLGFLNRLILDDVIIYDQQGLQLLNVARMTARVDLAQLATSSQISHAENRRILELSLPLKTNTLLFYGRAPLGTAYDGYANLSDC